MIKKNDFLFSLVHLKKWIFIISMIVLSTQVYSQKYAAKTNLLYDATGTINLGVEMSVAPQWTIELSMNYNPWTFSYNTKWKHLLLQPGARYWLCEKFNGHFFGVHLLGGIVNIGNLDINADFGGINFKSLNNYRYEGWFVGTGIAYGYSYILGRHWNLEGELGVGYIYTKYDRYEKQVCGAKLGNGDKNYFGLTKAAINLVYVF